MSRRKKARPWIARATAIYPGDGCRVWIALRNPSQTREFAARLTRAEVRRLITELRAAVRKASWWQRGFRERTRRQRERIAAARRGAS